jgi:hypothetical protein
MIEERAFQAERRGLWVGIPLSGTREPALGVAAKSFHEPRCGVGRVSPSEPRYEPERLLSPSLSPVGGGEGVRRTGEGDRFMAPIYVHSLEVLPFHE